MSYTTKIKNEILNLSTEKSEIIAELSAFIKNNAEIKKDKFTLSTENLNIAKSISTKITKIYSISPIIEEKDNANFTKKTLYTIIVDKKSNEILIDLGILNQNNTLIENTPEYLINSKEEIRSYIRGVFLTAGSINDPKTSRYHMELLIDDPKEAVFVQKLLNEYELNSKILTRDKGYMVYLKEAEKISDYIKILGASLQVLYFEDIRIYREQKNNANRLNNCEQANTDKVIQTATIQLEHIRIIEENLSVNLLDDKTKEALTYRKKYPDSSLKELAEIISLETNNKISKPGLNHRFRKIKELAQKLSNS